jgi:hypothetical protein
MPEIDLHYECTMRALPADREPGRWECGRDALYIVRGHSCETKRTGEGALRAACQAHIDEWEQFEYPTRCGGCRHAFNGPLDIIWEVCKL